MSAWDTFEQKGLFRGIRFLAILFIFILVAGFAFGCYVAYDQLSPAKPVAINANEVIDQIKPAPEVAAPAPATGEVAPAPAPKTRTVSPLAGYKIPFPLQKMVSSEDNAKWLSRFLKAEPPEYTDQILNELSSVVQAADEQHVDEADAVNAYHEMKVDRIQAEEAAKAGRKTLMTYFAEGAAAIILLVALLGLILVLLAIERNTRQPPARA
jgi:hypothetical protein